MSNCFPDGLAWRDEYVGPIPYWTREPKLSAVLDSVRKALRCAPDEECEVQFFNQGLFNKLYSVSSDRGAYVMRVTLPVDPGFKTRSEVATLQFVGEHSSIRVPKVIDYDATSDNPIGFEWILMEMMPGVRLRRKWNQLSMDKKQDIVRQVARMHRELRRKPFTKVGNLYHSDEAGYEVGRMVSIHLFREKHIFYDIDRGPYQTAHDWLSARIKLCILDEDADIKECLDEKRERQTREQMNSVPAKPRQSFENSRQEDPENASVKDPIQKDPANLSVDSLQEDPGSASDDSLEDDLQHAVETKARYQTLDSILEKMFPKTENEETYLMHDDVNMQNIMVDDDGEITAIVDWECVSTVPHWYASRIPSFLRGVPRGEEPDRANYRTAEEESDMIESDDIDNEGVAAKFWRERLEYEQTQLRPLYMDELECSDQICPEKRTDLPAVKADFENWITQASSGMLNRQFDEWVEGIEEGKPVSFSDLL